ncbi:MAG: DNA polymerase III subunit gamma/tau [Pseudomonadota bacterium]
MRKPRPMKDAGDPTERNDATLSMFGEAEGPQTDGQGGYQVLARKYRPRRFEDLIGQEAMVRTLTNAFETERVAHAFMLTGVRGIGKTTTARLLARGLNYTSDHHDGPSVHLDPLGVHCQSIMESRHPDVLELDAASRTGVADMRELLDGARYAPVSARYKVYIIDEVHMLSIAAFNALLKTLEEPPAHVKFIFATTEIRKVPVTVLSRCQRFDLKRLDVAGLATHLGRVAKTEGADVAGEALNLIARAAEGSVRDGLSILDQAIVQGAEGASVSGEQVRDMLGLGDRGRLLGVFDEATTGNGKAVLSELDDQLRAGADPLILLRDLLDIAADISASQAVGDGLELGGTADWTSRIQALAERLSPAEAARTWQILLQGYRDTQTAPDPAVALKMVVLRLVAAAGLPSPEDAARMLAESMGGAAAGGRSGATPAGGGGAGGGGLTSFADAVAAMERRKEIRLMSDCERFLQPAEFGDGHCACAVKEGAPADLLQRLGSFLEEETGLEWTITRAESGEETLRERADRVKGEKVAEAKADPEIQAFLDAIPGAEIVDVRQEGPVDKVAGGANVVNMPKRGSGSSR